MLIKSTIKSKQKEGGEKRSEITYPQSIHEIVPLPFTAWATSDNNLSEISAAATGKRKEIFIIYKYYHGT